MALDKKYQSSLSGEWHRIEAYNLVLMCHLPPICDPIHASHAHNDGGSFVLYRGGIPVFVDCGRLNYQEGDPENAFGQSAGAHNSICLDGLDPILTGRYYKYPNFYRSANTTTEYNECTRNIVQIS